VSEPNPPQGEEAIEWILLTTLPITTFEQVLLIIEYYASRWMIEILFMAYACKFYTQGRAVTPWPLQCVWGYYFSAKAQDVEIGLRRRKVAI